MTQRIAGPRPDQNEKSFDADLFNSQKGLAVRLGWRSYHVLRSKGSKAGFPDRVCYRDRVIYAELKASKGKPTDYQIETLTALAKAGAEVYLWRPDDLDEVGQILSRRWLFDPEGTYASPSDFEATESYLVPELRFVDGSSLRPKCAWLATGGRRDGG